jgi:hypothetical protein
VFYQPESPARSINVIEFRAAEIGVEQFPEDGRGAVGTAPSPSQAVTWRELLQQFRQRLGGEERQLADLRAQGRSWADIASLLGGSPDARRLQLARAVAWVSRELGLEEADEK